MDNRDVVSGHRKLALLQLLQQDPDYSINDTLLQQLLAAQGHGVSIAVVRADMAWLEQLSLLSISYLPGCYVAVLRSEGLDVASGISVVPGIARPRPV
ncbi:MAG: hypothetical protein CTY18_03095 [Methylomonas sp.]|nr:MAG: hypothetical protein CTY18_03095 [Methylomonas sp.]